MCMTMSSGNFEGCTASLTSVSGACHKGVLPEDVDECHLGFQESKPHTNTITWAPSEWHVAELGPLLLLFRPEPEEEHRISDKKTLELTLHP